MHIAQCWIALQDARLHRLPVSEPCRNYLLVPAANQLLSFQTNLYLVGMLQMVQNVVHELEWNWFPVGVKGESVM